MGDGQSRDWTLGLTLSRLASASVELATLVGSQQNDPSRIAGRIENALQAMNKATADLKILLRKERKKMR